LWGSVLSTVENEQIEKSVFQAITICDACVILKDEREVLLQAAVKQAARFFLEKFRLLSRTSQTVLLSTVSL
jgi:hypothetical protein